MASTSPPVPVILERLLSSPSKYSKTVEFPTSTTTQAQFPTMTKSESEMTTGPIHGSGTSTNLASQHIPNSANVSSPTNASDQNLLLTPEQKLLEKTKQQSQRCAALIQRIRAIQEEQLESHTRQQLNTLLRELGMDPSVIPPAEDRTGGAQEEGRRRKSVTVSSGTTYGNDDGNTGLESETPKSPKPKLQLTPTSMSERDLNQLERMSALLAKAVEERETMPSEFPATNSETTDSSSECSSDDDDCMREPETIYNYLPVEDDPKTKWAYDRAELICMWTWIRDSLANVSSHIAKQDVVYDRVKAAKAHIQFEETSSCQIPLDLGSSSNALLRDALVEVYPSVRGAPPVTYLHASSSKSTSQSKPYGNSRVGTAGTGERILIGGGLGKLNIDFGMPTEEGCTARRCLPLQTVKRRKIFHLDGVKNVAFQGKACSCFGKVELCSLCLNRSTKAKLIDCDVMNGREIVAHLDYCTHESLSLRDETRLDLLVDSSLKLGTWKKSRERRRYNFIPFTHVRHGTGVSESKSEYGEDGEKLEKRGRGRPRLISEKSKLEETKRKYIPRKLGGIQRGGFTDRERVKSLVPRRPIKKRKSSYRKLKDDDGDGLDEYGQLVGDAEEDYSWRTPATTGKVKHRATTSEQYRRSRREQDFDIDNIVIPYSIASATRVEKIEYKEIITPSWRTTNPAQDEISKKAGGAEDSGSDYEDMTEHTIMARHDRSEVEEHKKFSIAPSSRRARRADSKTECFDTPDTMSPMMIDVNLAGGSGDTLPPSPAGSSDDQPNLSMTAADASLALTALKLSTPAVSSRRRTISSSRKEEEIPPEEDDGIPPYEPRLFPLDDEDYDEMLKQMPDDFLLSPPAKTDGTKSSAGIEPTKAEPIPSPPSDKEAESSADEDDPDWECADGEI